MQRSCPLLPGGRDRDGERVRERKKERKKERKTERRRGRDGEREGESVRGTEEERRNFPRLLAGSYKQEQLIREAVYKESATGGYPYTGQLGVCMG